MGKTLSAVIITKNEQSMIADCLSCLKFADQRVVVDSGSIDNTVEIARREGAKVIETKMGKFKDWRNVGLHEATSDWILYIDADERVTPKLAEEIRSVIEQTSFAAFAIKRHNIHFGKWFQHGGWEDDVVVRLFKRAQLKNWIGDVHESARVDGNQGLLSESLVHFTHRDLLSGLTKSAVWTDTEARLLFESGAKKVGILTLLRKPFMEFIRRLVLKKGYQDGIEGWIESMQQAMNRFFVYERLWELQSKPSLPEKYQRFESEIQKMWEKAQ